MNKLYVIKILYCNTKRKDFVYVSIALNLHFIFYSSNMKGKFYVGLLVAVTLLSLFSYREKASAGTNFFSGLDYPFPEGEKWIVVQGYNTTHTHKIDNASNYDDKYALDIVKNNSNTDTANATVISPVTGYVKTIAAFSDPTFGKKVLICESMTSYYCAYLAHLGSVDVQEGNHVDQGDVVGKVANTEPGGINHLHFKLTIPSTSDDGIDALHASTPIDFGELNYPALSDSIFNQYKGTWLENTPNTAVKNDFDGDGDSDLAYGRDMGSGIMRWAVTRSSRTSFPNPNTWQNTSYQPSDKYFSGDFNGDHKTDLAFVKDVSDSQQQLFVLISNATSTVNSFAQATVWKSDFGNRGNNFYVGDFNGDKKDDFALSNWSPDGRREWWVSLSNGSSFTAETLWDTTTGGQTNDKFYIGDFDGNGKDDVATARIIDSTTVRWWVRKSLGTSFKFEEQWKEDYGNIGDRFYVGDFDGVNGDDIAIVRDLGNGYNRFYTSLSDKTQFLEAKTWHETPRNGSEQFIVADYTGDGKSDMAMIRTMPTTGYQQVYVMKAGIGDFSSWNSDFGDPGDKYL